MAVAISYTIDLSSDKKVINFEGCNGEKYVLTHELSWTIYGNSILNIVIECNTEKNVSIIAELCSPNANPIKTTALLENCVANLTFQNVNFLTPDLWTCIINVVPHFQLRDLQEPKIAVSTMLPSRKCAIKKAKLEQLSTDMQNILNTGDLSDVVLSEGDTKIHAHKVVLSARSPVFAKMFQHRMKENCENCVSISDIPGVVLKELVAFIYSGTIVIKDDQMARNLYIAADKYAVCDLRRLCSEFLQNVSFDDVLDTLALADLYEDKTLKHSALRFITMNYPQMKNCKGWDSFMKQNQSLAIEILSFIIENKV